jgi:hypothetical protein
MTLFLTIAIGVFVGLWLFKIRWLIFAVMIGLLLLIASYTEQN